MKRARLLLASASFIFMLAVPAVARAFTEPLRCPTIIDDEVSYNYDSCDLSIDKQVSVNGGPFENADTSGAAAAAQVGDTVTWKITVTNDSTPDLTPHGFVYINDVLPSSVSFSSYIASAGAFGSNTWTLPLMNEEGSNLPATLTLTTDASEAGLAQNTAAFSRYDPGGCDGCSGYTDANSEHDSNDAWVNIKQKPSDGAPPPPVTEQTPPPSNPPQVLGLSTTVGNPPQNDQPQVLAATTTLTNTGSGLIESLIAGLLAVSAIAVAAYGRLFRKQTT